MYIGESGVLKRMAGLEEPETDRNYIGDYRESIRVQERYMYRGS